MAWPKKKKRMEREFAMFLRTAREGEEPEKNHCFVAGAVIFLGALASHV